MSVKTNVYPPGTFKYLGTFQRGLIVILGEDVPPLRFGDEKTTSKKHIISFDMNNPEKRKQFETAIKSAPYDRGEIVYIDSPEEMRAKAKAKKQKGTLDNYKKMLSTGIFQLTEIENKKMDPLKLFAEQIGAEYECYNWKNKQIQPLRKEIILKNIRELLGSKDEEVEMETDVDTSVAKKEVQNGENTKRMVES